MRTNLGADAEEALSPRRGEAHHARYRGVHPLVAGRNPQRHRPGRRGEPRDPRYLPPAPGAGQRRARHGADRLRVHEVHAAVGKYETIFVLTSC